MPRNSATNASTLIRCAYGHSVRLFTGFSTVSMKILWEHAMRSCRWGTPCASGSATSALSSLLSFALLTAAGGAGSCSRNPRFS